MNDKNNHTPRYHLHRYLAAAYLLFIIYVSLSPFSGWQEQGLHFVDVLLAPPTHTFTWFDAILNCISYFPFGFLLAHTQRNHWTAPSILIWATITGFSVSLMLEYTQMYLPSRVSSNIDLLSNTTGTFCGSVLALTLLKYTWFARVKIWHEQWIKYDKTTDFGLALLASWVFAQVNPSLPMLGSVFVSAIARWPFDIVQAAPFNWLECAEVTLNMLLLGVLLSTLMRKRRNTLSALLLILGSVTLIKFMAAVLLLKSWALLLWLNSEAMLGILIGLLLLFLLRKLTSRWLLRMSFLSAFFYLALVFNLILGSSRHSVMRLFHWQYIHMLNYNGLSQFINLIFPVLLLGYLWRTDVLRK